MNDLLDRLRGIRPQIMPAEYNPCPTCQGEGTIYVEEEYAVDFTTASGETVRKVWQTWQVPKPCPDCAPPRCQICDDQGEIRYNVPIGHELFGKLFPCPACAKGHELMLLANKRALKNAQLPANYAQLTFETFDRLPARFRDGKLIARAAMARWVLSEGRRVSMAEVYQDCGQTWTRGAANKNSLVLTGPLGTGKTGLVAAAVNAMAERGQALLYIRVNDLFSNLREAFDADQREASGGMSADGILDRVKRAPLLALDELTECQSVRSDWRREQIETIFRYRYGEGLATLVTTNNTAAQMETHWGTRTTSVLYAMAHEIEVSGRPLRFTGARYEDAKA